MLMVCESESTCHDADFGVVPDGELIQERRFRVLVLFCEHYVREGDSLQSIANAHGNIASFVALRCVLM